VRRAAPPACLLDRPHALLGRQPANAPGWKRGSGARPAEAPHGALSQRRGWASCWPAAVAWFAALVERAPRQPLWHFAHRLPGLWRPRLHLQPSALQLAHIPHRLPGPQAWLSAGTGPRLRIAHVFTWSGGTWDVLGTHYASTNSEGSFKDPEIFKWVAEHNAKVNGIST
jgi:hypothetical protein